MVITQGKPRLGQVRIQFHGTFDGASGRFDILLFRVEAPPVGLGLQVGTLGMRQGKVRVFFDHLCPQIQRQFKTRTCRHGLSRRGARLQKKVIGTHVGSGHVIQVRPFLGRQGQVQRRRDGRSDFTLNGKDVPRGQLPVKGLRPQVLISLRVDQLCIDTQAVTGSLHAAFEQRARSQFLPDLTHVLWRIAIFHDRSTGNHFQAGQLGQLCQQVIVDSVCKEVGILGRRAGVAEWQDGNGPRIEFAD